MSKFTKCEFKQMKKLADQRKRKRHTSKKEQLDIIAQEHGFQSWQDLIESNDD